MEQILDCGHAPSEHSEFTTGYGMDSQGKKHCYECCGEMDKQQMRDHDRITLYWSNGEVKNWPGSFRIKTYGTRKSWHNIARYRYDFWFMFEGQEWHGVQYGDNTELAHCKKLKQKQKKAA